MEKAGAGESGLPWMDKTERTGTAGNQTAESAHYSLILF